MHSQVANNCSISDFTEDLLASIILLLPWNERVRVERVCRRWQRTSTERCWEEKHTQLDSRQIVGESSEGDGS